MAHQPSVISITAIGSWGAYPAAGEATSSFLLQAPGANFLIDCGSGVISLLQQWLSLDELDAVFLSHYHWDHAADIGCLQYAARIGMDLGRRRRPLPIYGHTEGDDFSRLDYLSYTFAEPIDLRHGVDLEGLIFTFARNLHPDPCFSMRVEARGRSLVYITDTEWADHLVEFADRADLLICESSLYDEHRGRVSGHLSAGEAGRLAAAARVKRLVLTHLPHWGEHPRLLDQARAEFKATVDLAAAGKVWTL
jgi:ribonuclease BN (tRNA processing enzyme)